MKAPSRSSSIPIRASKSSPRKPGGKRWTKARVLRELKCSANLRVREKMAYFGVRVPKAFGISAPLLHALARRIGKNHQLAEQLWSSGIHEGRILATLVGEPGKVTPQQMERWARRSESGGRTPGRLAGSPRTPFVSCEATRCRPASVERQREIDVHRRRENRSEDSQSKAHRCCAHRRTLHPARLSLHRASDRNAAAAAHAKIKARRVRRRSSGSGRSGLDPCERRELAGERRTGRGQWLGRRGSPAQPGRWRQAARGCRRVGAHPRLSRHERALPPDSRAPPPVLRAPALL